MKGNFRAALSVNNTSFEINAFVEQFLARTAVGAISSLKGAEDIRDLELYLKQGDVRVMVNGNELPLTPFPNDVIANTLVGLVSSLKGVGDIKSLHVSVKTE